LAKKLYIVAADRGLSRRIVTGGHRSDYYISRALARSAEGAAATVAPSLEGRVEETAEQGPLKRFRVFEGGYEGSEIIVIDVDKLFEED
jgi:hypothetical protein